MASSLCLIAVAGCGDDDDDSTGTGGSSAKGGAGTGGSTAKGGSGGSTNGGSGGGATGGSPGTGGGTTGGNGGSSGMPGGASGAGGEPVVEGGAAGSGATAGIGNGGAGGTDLGGAAGAGGSASELACNAYCTAIMATCSASADLQYPDMEHCLGTCPAFPHGAAAGSTFECRAQHAALAATAGVEPHCQHAGPAGLGPCGGPCPAYCSLMMNICEGKFASEEACLTACESVPGGSTATLMTDFTAPVAAGNTLACRIYHATNAAAATTVASHDMHCGHAAGESLCVP